MKRYRYFLLLPILALTGIACWLSVSYAQSPEPRSILEKAIKAHGGAENIGKPRIGTLKSKSEVEGPEITNEEIFDLPRRWKRVTSATVNGKRRVAFTLMIDGKLWQWDEGMEPQESQNLEDAASFFAPVSSLLNLTLDLTQEKVKLSRLRKTTVNGESAVGFRAAWDRSKSDFYFNEKTGLLAQGRFTFHSGTGKDLEAKTVFSEYEAVDGVKLAQRRTTYMKLEKSNDFVMVADPVVTELRILTTIPNEVFAFPDKNR